MNLLRFLFAAAVYATLGTGATWAGGLDSLDAFVKNVKSGRASFNQTVTVPAKDGQVVRPKVSSGSFEFARPNRFKFVYKKPFEQSIVADGQTLWLYDVDLAQVTARKQAAALGSTPAALIAAALIVIIIAADIEIDQLVHVPFIETLYLVDGIPDDLVDPEDLAPDQKTVLQ